MRFKTLSIALLLGIAGTASAGSNTSTLQVSADAVNTCYIQTAALDFGQVPAVVNYPIQGIGNIDLQCSPDTSYSILAGPGNNFTNLSQRNLAANGVLLAYDLYTDGSSTMKWGDINQAQGMPISGNSGALGGVASIPVYGTILAGQIVPSNWYYDTVALTVEFN